jgi:hypothetical protein
MKTEWQFIFETKGFKFHQKIRYKGEVSKPDESNNNESKLEYIVNIVPEDTEPFPGSDQIGKLLIEIPLRPKESKDLAYSIAYLFQENISYTHGKMKIHTGLIGGRRIAENDIEKHEIGDKPYFAEVRMETVDEPCYFDSQIFRSSTKRQNNLRLKAQYNTALAANNEIDKYTGLFKIIEDQFCGNKKKEYMKDVLKSSNKFFNIFSKTFFHSNGSTIKSANFSKFTDFVDKIVNIRNQCSHLKHKNYFGYTYDDPRIKTEVMPAILELDPLIRHLIDSTE